MAKVVDLERLTRYDVELKTQVNVLQRSKAYKLNEWVCRGNIYLKCTTAGTTAGTTLNLSGATIGDTLTDGTVTWTIFDPFAGIGGGADILYSGTAWNSESTSIVTKNISDYEFMLVNYSLSSTTATSEYDVTRLFMTSDLALIDLGVEIDTSNYVSLAMKKTSATGFNISFSEFAGFGYYRINAILGIVGGGSDASITWATQQEVEALF